MYLSTNLLIHQSTSICLYKYLHIYLYPCAVIWLLIYVYLPHDHCSYRLIKLTYLSPSNSFVSSSPPSHYFPIFVHISIVSLVTCPSSPRSLVIQTTKVHIWAVQPTRSSPLTEQHHHSHLYPLTWKLHNKLARTWRSRYVQSSVGVNAYVDMHIFVCVKYVKWD